LRLQSAQFRSPSFHIASSQRCPLPCSIKVQSHQCQCRYTPRQAPQIRRLLRCRVDIQRHICHSRHQICTSNGIHCPCRLVSNHEATSRLDTYEHQRLPCFQPTRLPRRMVRFPWHSYEQLQHARIAHSIQQAQTFDTRDWCPHHEGFDCSICCYWTS
jgi:hypothetical protein